MRPDLWCGSLWITVRRAAVWSSVAVKDLLGCRRLDSFLPETRRKEKWPEWAICRIGQHAVRRSLKTLLAGIVLAVTASLPASASTRPGWVQQPVPVPANGQDAELYAISCPAARDCTAVGLYQTTTGNQIGLAEQWNGEKWSVQDDAAAGGEGTNLHGVACLTIKSCVAVGVTLDAANDSVVMFAGIWNGTGWSATPVPAPDGAMSDELTQVSCVSVSNCFAVGNYSTTSSSGGTGDQTLIERWNGKSWAIQSSPSLPGGMYGVACQSGSSCFAVGQTGGSQPYRPVAEHWNGQVWTVLATPALPDYQGNAPRNAWLTSVSCAANQCEAVGSIEYEGGLISQNLAERWAGSKWVIQPTPDPAAGYNNDLLGISCASAPSCTSVGEVFDSDTGENSVASDAQALTWNGSRWSNDDISDPSDGTGSGLFGTRMQKR
jgi:hypothetical protein